MKLKIIIPIIAIILVAFVSVFANQITQFVATIVDFRIFLNGEERNFDLPVVVIENHTYVPLRELSEQFGMNVEWDGDNNKIKIAQNDISQIFTSNDIYDLNYAIGQTSAEFVEIFGSPIRIEPIFEGTWGDYVRYYHYDFGIVRVNPYGTIEIMTINTNAYPGPRDIRVGDHFLDVLRKFPIIPNDTIDYWFDILYWISFDVRGEIEFDDNNNVIRILYSYGYENFNEYNMSWGNGVSFEVEDNRVKSISLFLLNLN